MKFSEFSNDTKLDEVLPAVGAALGAGARAVGSAVTKGAQAVGSALSKGAQAVATNAATTLASGQAVTSDPAAQAKMLAQQAIDRANKKKEIQDQIKNKQKELADLQKELALIK